jgi:hypothetical protein
MGGWVVLDIELEMLGFFLTLYFVLRELVESLSLLDDGVSVFRIPFTVVLDSGSRPRLC